MTTQRIGARRRIAGGAALLAPVGAVVAAGLIGGFSGDHFDDPLLTIGVMLIGLVGGFIILRRPGNMIGPVLAVTGFAGCLSGVSAALGGGGDQRWEVLLASSPQRLVGIVLGDGAFFVFIAGAVGLVPLLFPSGRPPSKRWRPVAWVLGAGLVVQAVLAVFKPELCVASGAGGEQGCVANPIGIPWLPPPEAVLLLVVFPGAVLGVASLFVRHRRSVGVERLQLRWMTFSLMLVVAATVVEIVLSGVLGVGPELLRLGPIDPLGLGLVAVPVSIGMAVLRYRLYEIDRVVSRTVSYGLVLAALGGLFGLVVALPTSVFGRDDTPSWVVAGSTLLVAALFDPLRRRLQVRVDRRFNRSRYDAQLVVDGFGRQIRDTSDPGSVTAAMVEVAGSVFHPESVRVWVREKVSEP